MNEAGLQEWSLTPTLEQGVVTIVQEELKPLLVEACNECGGENALTVDDGRKSCITIAKAAYYNISVICLYMYVTC